MKSALGHQRGLDGLRGVSILLHSSDDEELLAVADRVLVFNGGRVVAELSGAQRTRVALYQAAYASTQPGPTEPRAGPT